jgi:hypothetical protein
MRSNEKNININKKILSMKLKQDMSRSFAFSRVKQKQLKWIIISNSFVLKKKD